MKLVLACTSLLFALSTHAAEVSPTVDSKTLEGRLNSIEFKSDRFASGKEKFIGGLATLPPRLQLIACQAYPVNASAESIALLKSDIAFLEQSENYSQLSQEQAARLATRKDLVGKFTPGFDCAALK